VLLQVCATSIASILTIEILLRILGHLADTSRSDVLLHSTLQHRDLRDRRPWSISISRRHRAISTRCRSDDRTTTSWSNPRQIRPHQHRHSSQHTKRRYLLRSLASGKEFRRTGSIRLHPRCCRWRRLECSGSCDRFHRRRQTPRLRDGHVLAKPCGPGVRWQSACRASSGLFSRPLGQKWTGCLCYFDRILWRLVCCGWCLLVRCQMVSTRLSESALQSIVH
jgi:hypothetical protein